ncbi:MAG: hypothetical protein HOK82_18160 [Rhodospirillaceae bacterium]|nr:hypothetical protein [Rhodospirillaceae bacterium]
MLRAFVIVCTMSFLPTNVVAAQQKTFPSISGSLPMEIENDWAYRSDDRANQNNDLYIKTEPEITVQIAPSWSVFAHGVLEPIGSPDQFENRVFEDLGLYLEDLYLSYDDGTFGIRAGKLNVGFGVGWDRTPGLYGTDFGEAGYEISERIGIIGSATLNSDSGGMHTLSAGSFFQDTTLFSQSTLRGRGDTRKEDGGVSNTESFESFIVALDGGKIKGLGALGYHVAYMHQARGIGDAEDENAVAVALFTQFDLGGGVTFSPLAEFVHQDNAGGVHADRDFLTLAGQAQWKGFNLALAWTGRDTEDGTSGDDFQFQVSAGYAFKSGISIDIGWKTAQEAGIDTETVGALATYTIEF